MGEVTTEAFLNLVWALLCVGALSCHFWRERRRTGDGNRVLRLQRALSVFVAAVALFPVISASDDRVGLSDIYAPSISQAAAFHTGKVHNASPAPPLEDPEHGQTTAPFLLFALLISYFLAARTKTPRLIRWCAYGSLGRAPPSCLA